MSRTRAEAQITTRNARRQLKPRKKPYWRSLGPNAAIGYRRRPRGGFWMAGEYLGEGRYREEQIGVADDHLDADGIDTLDFEQAKARAAEKIASWRSHDTRQPARARSDRQKRRRGLSRCTERRRAGQGIKRPDARSRMRKHVLGDAIADVPLHELTEHHLVQWRERRPSELAPATVKRIVIDLKAALNATAKKHRAKLPADIAVTIKHGLSFSDASAPVARDGAALSDHDVRRVLDAAAADRRRRQLGWRSSAFDRGPGCNRSAVLPDRPHARCRFPDRPEPPDGADIEEGPHQRRQEHPYRHPHRRGCR